MQQRSDLLPGGMFRVSLSNSKFLGWPLSSQIQLELLECPRYNEINSGTSIADVKAVY